MPRKRRTPISGREAILRSEADPVLMARLAREREEREERVASWRRAEQPVVADLRALGLDLKSVWDLVNTNLPYPEAVPVLFRHLQLDYPERVLEGIARSLIVKEAAGIWDDLLRAFIKVLARSRRPEARAALLAHADDPDLCTQIGRLRKRWKDRGEGS